MVFPQHEKRDRLLKPMRTFLTELGRRGWELVTVHPLTLGANEFCFRHQIDTQKMAASHGL